MKQVNNQQEVIRFGVFEVDLHTGELRRKGRLVRLQEQPLQVLTLLLARPGELVTREELRQALWPADTFVDFEHGLNKAISKLRVALGDDSGTPRYIETLPRRGYRFIVPVTLAIPLSESAESPRVSGDQPDLPATTSPPKIRWKTYATVLSLGLFVLLAAWLVLKLTRKQPHPAAAGLNAPIRSLAVLPLQNLSGDKNQEYFAEGMTDELITDLGQMSALRVISRTSVMRYKQTSKTLPPLPQIGRELGADAIVEGTVFRSGNRVRITAQLIDARSDRHLWARAYERDLRDVITLQDEVARDIADEVRVKLTPQERARLTVSHAVNPEAHEAYLKGRYYWNQFTPEGMKRSLPFFEEAIAKDPNYALGYSGLADFYGVAYVRMGTLSHDEACPEMEDFSRKAVELDGSLSEGHNSLGGTRWFCDWDWDSAEREFKRALQLNPNYAEAHRLYSLLLAYSGRSDEAVAQMKRAVENDPMSPDINLVLGVVYYMTRQYELAAMQYRKTIEIDPKRAAPHWGLAGVYLQTGQFDRAKREYNTASELSGDQAGFLLDRAYADALVGKRAEALATLERLKELSTHQPVSTFNLAHVYTALGDNDHALALLVKAYESHDPSMLHLKVDPMLDSLHANPRFQDLVHGIGL